MTTTTTEIDTLAPAVHHAVAEALGLDDDEVTTSATLLGDLDAESIDLLDILFRIERTTGLKVQTGDIADHVQGGIPDEEFGDEDGIITPAGLAQLKRAMPQIDVDELAGTLEAEQIMGLFTVGNLVELVATVAARSGE